MAREGRAFLHKNDVRHIEKRLLIHRERELARLTAKGAYAHSRSIKPMA